MSHLADGAGASADRASGPVPNNAARLRRQRAKFAAAIGIAVVTSCLADVSLKHGLAGLSLPDVHTVSDALQCLKLIVADRWILAGVCLIVTDFAAFFRALQIGSLSVAIPLRATTYVITPLMAHALLGEPIPGGRWLALTLVLIGVGMVGRSAMDGM